MMEIRTALKCFNQRKCRFLTPCFYVCKRPVSISVKRGFYARKIPWCGDITYIPTNEGWLYLASVIDLGTRRLVGYSFGARIDKRLVMDALSKAFRHERPRAGCLFHSDQGSQYCS